MKIVLNAYNLKVGGGLNVAFNFIEQLKKYTTDQFYAFVPENCGYEKLETSHIRIIPVPSYYQIYAMRYFLEHYWLPRKIKAIDPDIIFSMGNFPLPIKVKQALLFHFPYLIYDFLSLVNLTAKERLILFFQHKVFRSRLKYAQKIFPQTHVASERLRIRYGNHLNLHPIPNAYSKLEPSNSPGKQFFSRVPGVKYLLCLTKYYPHKNVEILLEVAQHLKRNNADIKIITTIGADQHKNAKRFIDDIKVNQLEDFIINMGPVGLFDVPRLYAETDGLILPTYMESFTATYVDAMFFKKPIFTSDMDFAQEVCGGAAFYFNPSDAEDIYKVIDSAFRDPDLIRQKISLGSQRSIQFPDWEKVAEMYVSQLNSL